MLFELTEALMQAQCVRIPLFAGKTQRFVDWMREAKSRKREMLESMSIEGVCAEAIFLEGGETEDSIVFYMRAHDLARAQQAFASSELAIDKATRDIIAECWDVARARPLDVLLELEAPEGSGPGSS
ncbi:DUF6176 family protein [Sorangium sp. So ce363]|uniref:DUF6176 family protein n=1 Tax=Sorangium sp. So ce363 TaxID=3133304 RepID=UPI003F63D827